MFLRGSVIPFIMVLAISWPLVGRFATSDGFHLQESLVRIVGSQSEQNQWRDLYSIKADIIPSGTF